MEIVLKRPHCVLLMTAKKKWSKLTASQFTSVREIHVAVLRRDSLAQSTTAAGPWAKKIYSVS